MADKKPTIKLNKGIRDRIRGCIETYAATLKVAELESLVGKEAAEAITKQYAQTAVSRAAKVMRSEMRQGQNAEAAEIAAMKEWRSTHYRYWRKFKSEWIGQVVRNNELAGLAKQFQGDIGGLCSALLVGGSYLPVAHIKSSVAYLAHSLKNKLLSPFFQELANISKSSGVELTDVIQTLMGNKQSSADVVNSILRGAEGDELTDKVARAVIKFTDYVHKTKERAGIFVDYNPDHVLSVIHDAHKMVNPTEDNVVKYGETTWAEYQAMSHLEQNKIQRKTWRNYMIEHSDPEKSFPDNYMPTRKIMNETYDIAFDNIISEDVIRTKNGRAVGYKAKLEGGKRQIIAKDGESFMAMRQYGEPDLFANINQIAYTSGTQIGMVSNFGPDPAVGLDFVIKKVKELHGVSPTVNEGVARLRSDFNYYATTSAIKADARTERFLHYATAAPKISILGSLAIKSLGDSWTTYSMAKLMGIPNPGRVALDPIFQYFSGWAKTEGAQELMREFKILDESVTSAYNEVLTRELLESGDPIGYVSKIQDTMSQFGGIGKWDMYQKLSITKAWAIEFGESTKSDWDSLRSYTRMSLEQGGITKNVWNIIRKAPQLTKRLQGRDMLVPFEAHAIPDKIAAQAFNIPITHRGSLQRAKNIFALKLSSILHEQAEAVSPTFNPMRDKEFLAEKQAILANHHEKVGGVNMKYVFFVLMNQFKTWSTNYFDVAMKRMWQSPGTQAAKIARMSEMVIGGAMTNTALDVMLHFITNQDEPKNKSLVMSTIHGGISNFGGRIGVMATALWTAIDGHGQGMNRAASLTVLSKWINAILHVAVPRKDHSHVSELAHIAELGAQLSIPSAVIYGILKHLVDSGG